MVKSVILDTVDLEYLFPKISSSIPAILLVDKEPVIFALGIKETGEYELLGFYLTVKESHNAYITGYFSTFPLLK